MQCCEVLNLIAEGADLLTRYFVLIFYGVESGIDSKCSRFILFHYQVRVRIVFRDGGTLRIEIGERRPTVCCLVEDMRGYLFKRRRSFKNFFEHKRGF